MRISWKPFSFYLIDPLPYCFVRKVSVKCSETVAMNLHIFGNTFVSIRINSHTMHFHHSNWFQIVCDCWIYLYHEQSEKKYSAKWDRGLSISAKALVNMPSLDYVRPHTTRFLSCDASDRIRYETTGNRRGFRHLTEIGTLATHLLTLND